LLNNTETEQMVVLRFLQAQNLDIRFQMSNSNLEEILK